MSDLWPVWRQIAALVWGFNPVVSFMTVFGLTIGAMYGLQWVWDGHMPTYAQQFKGFFYGDILLALVAALLQPLVVKLHIVGSPGYWLACQLLGVIGGILFVIGEFLQGKMKYWCEIVTPPLLYHHLVLFPLLIPILGGTVWLVLWNGGLHYWQSWIVLGLILVYIGLNVYDGFHPPVKFGPAPGSLGDRFAQYFLHSRS